MMDFLSLGVSSKRLFSHICQSPGWAINWIEKGDLVQQWTSVHHGHKGVCIRVLEIEHFLDHIKISKVKLSYK